MNKRSGLTFADVLILVALVLLLAALAVPRFVKAPDYGNEEDEMIAETTNTTAQGESPGSKAEPEITSGNDDQKVTPVKP
jgi:type II secretory pathway pseudopilin PulG